MRYLQNALTSEIWVTWINELIILTIYINVICWENIILQRLYICLVVCNFSLMPYFVHCVSFLLYFNFCSDDEPLRHNRVDLTPGLCYPESDQAHAPLGSKLTRFQGVVNRKWKHAHDEDKRYVFTIPHFEHTDWTFIHKSWTLFEKEMATQDDKGSLLSVKKPTELIKIHPTDNIPQILFTCGQ